MREGISVKRLFVLERGKVLNLADMTQHVLGAVLGLDEMEYLAVNERQRRVNGPMRRACSTIW
jgi:hypothetical protein